MDIYKEALLFHKENKGKIDVVSKVKTENEHDLALAYSPGVAQPCREIAKNPDLLNTYTARANMIAVVSDGSAVLGLGNIGARASLPVMEGKCVLFKQFGGVSAFPVCIDSQDSDVIVNTIKLLEPSFSGINLEDIAAPHCFKIESRLKAETKMLIFHDDQHGTAIVTIAGLLNAVKYYKLDLKKIKIVINGAGSAGYSIVKMLSFLGVGNIIVCDTKGIIYKNRPNLNFAKSEIAELTNPQGEKGSLAEALNCADVFIGVSVADQLSAEMVSSMAKKPVIFALANPEPEIKYELAKSIGIEIIATGRSDYPNQVNNVLAFPGIFRGALDCNATDINMEMKIAAARAIASVVENEINTDYIIPKPFDRRVLSAVATAVAAGAVRTGVAPADTDIDWIEYKARSILR
ncbi:MAG: NAD-dependent malic enzyme [Actinobacteria bacterium]|nr:NAD-dependent malic enzyme [Actinomycetota bacterium]